MKPLVSITSIQIYNIIMVSSKYFIAIMSTNNDCSWFYKQLVKP